MSPFKDLKAMKSFFLTLASSFDFSVLDFLGCLVKMVKKILTYLKEIISLSYNVAYESRNMNREQCTQHSRANGHQLPPIRAAHVSCFHQFSNSYQFDEINYECSNCWDFLLPGNLMQEHLTNESFVLFFQFLHRSARVI